MLIIVYVIKRTYIWTGCFDSSVIESAMLGVALLLGGPKMIVRSLCSDEVSMDSDSAHRSYADTSKNFFCYFDAPLGAPC